MQFLGQSLKNRKEKISSAKKSIQLFKYMTEKLEIYIYMNYIYILLFWVWDIYICIYTHVYQHTHSTHMHVYIHIHTNIYTHTHTYIHKPSTSQKATAISYTIGGTVKWHNRLVKLCTSFLKNSLNFICPSHSTLRYLPKISESTVYKNTCTWMFITAFFLTIAKHQKQLSVN